MASGILLTGLVSLIFFKLSVVTDANGSIIALTSIGNTIFLSGFKWIVMLAPLGVVFYMSAKINKMSASTAQTTFWVFASLMGISLSSIFLTYTGASITRVFFITYCSRNLIVYICTHYSIILYKSNMRLMCGGKLAASGYFSPRSPSRENPFFS